MYEDIKIKLHPYLGCSKNLMEFFVVIGYEEKILNEINLEDPESEKNLKLSIISDIISDLAFNVFEPDTIIKQIYPDIPNIIRDNNPPQSSNIVFSSCFDSMDGSSKVFFSCYALRFYEKYKDKKNIEYFVPKAFLILSQYPYFSTFRQICLKFISYSQLNIGNKIPLEILIHCFVNYLPSPIRNNLILKDFSPNIFIPKLSAYPYADFDICAIFNYININEFIKIYILIFLELDLLFFSPKLEKLNIFMFILYILNYPLTDSNYFWHIKSISKKEIEAGNDTMNTSYIGINTEFNWEYDLSNFSNLNFIVDVENKKNCINRVRKDEESQEIEKLLKYVNHILNNKKKDKSFFLNDLLSSLKNKIKLIYKDYNNYKDYLIKLTSFNNGINFDSFFYVDQKITIINRQVQEVFYDFMLNILVILNKDFEIDTTNAFPIKKRSYMNPQYSEEEEIFLKYSRKTIKYNTYFDLFIKRFKAADELKVSLLFSDEYVNLKKKDINQKMANIKYFDIMDSLYSLRPKNEEVNFNSLYNEFLNLIEPKILGKFYKQNYTQLFALNHNLIKFFIFNKKNKGCYPSLKKEKELNVEIIDKMFVPLTIQNSFYEILNQEYYIRSSLIYIFSITFPLFKFQDSLCFLTDIFKGIEKIQFFQRYYLYIILKSLHKYYEENEKNCQFPELILDNIINYCKLINIHLMNNKIVPNEEIFLFFKKIFNKKNNKEEKKNTSTCFVFKNKEEKLDNNIQANVVKYEDNLLIFNFKGIQIKKNFLNNAALIQQTIYSIHDNYFSNHIFSLERLKINELLEIIINLIFNLENERFKDLEVANYLINLVVILKNLMEDLNEYKEKKKFHENE